jgi:hypothetical protein
MPGPLRWAHLKEKQRSFRAGFPEPLGLQVHRALSWLGRAEKEVQDSDVRFVLLWVGFNAAYANDLASDIDNERSAFQVYFDALVALDAQRRIYNVVWTRFPHEIRLLLNDKYVFAPFWNHHNGLPGCAEWSERLSKGHRVIAAALAQQDTPKILSVLFDRLYVLRNQLLHGGATWNSGVNRQQVRDGAAIMDWLLPIFIDIMMDHPSHDWGRPFYPVVE